MVIQEQHEQSYGKQSNKEITQTQRHKDNLDHLNKLDGEDVEVEEAGVRSASRHV